MTDEIAVRVPKAAEMVGISKTKMYQLINREDCDFAFMLDGCRLVSVSKLKAWIDRQTEVSAG